MSPTEFELRAALRAGEGDGVDADAVIGRAMSVRHARRVRVGSIAAAAIVVGAVSVGAVTLNGNGHSRMNAGSGTSLDRAGLDYASSQSAGTSNGVGGGASAPTSGNVPKQELPVNPAAAACPASAPQLVLPGGGGSGQFGSGDPLFASAVAHIRVCGYASGNHTTAQGVSIDLSGSQAAALALEISSGSITSSAKPCPTLAPGQRKAQLDLIASDTQGKAMDPVVVTVFCGNMATNGTAVRYDFTLNTIKDFVAKLS
jgi:hypothetical protein